MDFPLLIRKAGLDDIKTLESLARQIWPKAYGEILSPPQIAYMLDLFYRSQALKEQFESQHQFLIAEIDLKEVGFASSSEILPGTFKLQKLYVSHQVQGQGIGKALIDEVVREVEQLGAKVLHLNVNRHNKALSFYKRYGFSVIGEEDIDIGDGFEMNDYVMEFRIVG